MRWQIVLFFFILSFGSFNWTEKSSTKELGNQLKDQDFINLTEELLTTWCDAMLELQIDHPDDPSIHGALNCPACNKIHGRCMDAVYPFMYMADQTGDEKYLKAAIDVMNWSKNVSMPDGSWTVIPDPKSWKGISVFGAIALGEALKYHGHLLTEEKRIEWMDRLGKAGEYIYDQFYMGFSHINYGITSIYALHLLGEQLNREDYIAKAKEMAIEIPNWITPNDSLIYGEDSPADKRSAKGLLPVDLGYNVEETLNGAVLYAMETQNHSLLNVLQTVLEQHLEFLLPDGAWDNSWGTRQNKWSYWGSRTTDGCQPAFASMADRNPALGTAAFLNTKLLKECTVDGLLAGGPHYQSHGVKPCVHHTFAHAKSLAFVLDNTKKLSSINLSNKVPRQAENGLQHFKDIDVWIANKDEWTATISTYDNEFKTKGSNQATGGAMSVLFHEKVGLLLAASMAKYKLAEKNNQQPQPGEEFATTPRLEVTREGIWYTNLYDMDATVRTEETLDEMAFYVHTSLRDANRTPIYGKSSEIHYYIRKNEVIFEIPPSYYESRFVFPLVSPSYEEFELENRQLTLYKSDAKVNLESTLPLTIKETEGRRIFNMVPGIEVIPISIDIPKGQLLTVKLTVK
ncbi:hypothetical protein [Portibacter marinus]|uniref:hypothetical protein n=1 Tax=Portibacter marinus TaxID=2898660 RepID=UPI001F398F34|nr:hypothetical protein [Portibacter marinus]